MIILKKRSRCFLNFIISSENRVLKNDIGTFCVYSVENGALTIPQLDVLRRFILLKTKKKTLIRFVAQPLQSVSSKSLGSRMGSGKGAHSHFVFKVRAGSKLVAFDNVTIFQVMRLVKSLRSFFPFRVKILYHNLRR